MFNKYGGGEHVLLLNSCSPDQVVTNSNQSRRPIPPIVPPRLDGIPVHVPESLWSIQCRILSQPTLHVSNFSKNNFYVASASGQTANPVLPIDGVNVALNQTTKPVNGCESVCHVQGNISTLPLMHAPNFQDVPICVASASGQTANPVLPIDGVNVALGQTTKPVRSIHYDQPSNRLAVNVTLLHRFSKSAESINVNVKRAMPKIQEHWYLFLQLEFERE